MSDLQQLKHKANEQIKDLINRNILKSEWDVRIITIKNNDFLYIDCDTSLVSIKVIKELCSQNFTNDLIYKLTY